MSGELQTFLQQLFTSIQKQTLIKITLGNRRVKSAELKNVFIKPVLIKNVAKLSFVYRFPTKDITKNFDEKESIMLIEQMMQRDFLNADIFTSESDLHFAFQKDDRVKFITRPASLKINENINQHDKEKIRLVKSADNIYLKELGITNAEGVVKKDMQHKYKQINRYIEIIEGIIKELKFKPGCCSCTIHQLSI